MALVIPPPSTNLAGDSFHQERHCPAPTGDVAQPPSLDPELIRRFRELVDEVTDQLAQGRDVDPQACRADAIALLVATNEHLADAPGAAESPLLYLLLEEQQKAAALSGNAAFLGDAALAFVRA